MLKVVGRSWENTFFASILPHLRNDYFFFHRYSMDVLSRKVIRKYYKTNTTSVKINSSGMFHLLWNKQTRITTKVFNLDMWYSLESFCSFQRLTVALCLFQEMDPLMAIWLFTPIVSGFPVTLDSFWRDRREEYARQMELGVALWQTAIVSRDQRKKKKRNLEVSFPKKSYNLHLEF